MEGIHTLCPHNEEYMVVLLNPCQSQTESLSQAGYTIELLFCRKTSILKERQLSIFLIWKAEFDYQSIPCSNGLLGGYRSGFLECYNPAKDAIMHKVEGGQYLQY